MNRLPTAAQRRVVVCADDFGLTAGACASILALGAAGRISATSCAVDGAYAGTESPGLRELRSNVAIGLHLNLTENPTFPGSASLRHWILATRLRRGIEAQALQSEVRRQFDRFEQLFSAAPDFLDGHEHVHQFPVIREIVLDELSARYRGAVMVRCTWPRHYRGPKALVIAMLGAAPLRRELAERGMLCNRDFAGVYDLAARSGYATRMEEWLRNIDDGGLVMCHPELEPSGSPLTARAHEHAFLSSPDWPRVQRGWNVALIPFRRSAFLSRPGG